MKRIPFKNTYFGKVPIIMQFPTIGSVARWDLVMNVTMCGCMGNSILGRAHIWPTTPYIFLRDDMALRFAADNDSQTNIRSYRLRYISTNHHLRYGG